MTFKLRNLRSASLAASLMCTIALSSPTGVTADDVVIDSSSSATNPGLTNNLGPGDTLIILDGVVIDPDLDPSNNPIRNPSFDIEDLPGGTVINYGTIAPNNTLASDGHSENGILILNSAGTSVINYGQISSGNDRNNVGIFSFGSQGASVINNGVIKALGEQDSGIRVTQSDDATIINNGLIAVENVGHQPSTSPGVAVSTGITVRNSDNATLTNNGIIDVQGYSSVGLYSYNSSNLALTNNGSITIKKSAAVNNPADDRAPDGTIYKTGRAWGIRAYVFNASTSVPGVYIVNNGTITSYVLQSRGIYIDGANGPTWNSTFSTAVNNGTIRMLSDDPSNGTYDADGMRAEGHDTTLINNGLIDIRPKGFGMQNIGSGGTVQNFGTILVYNEDSHGIRNVREPGNAGIGVNRTENYGAIYTYGANSHGISATIRPWHDVVNAGRVISFEGYAINLNLSDLKEDGSTGSIALTLLDGSVMYGDVFLATNNVPYTTMHMGDGLNARVRFDTANGGQPLDTNTTSHHNSHVWVGDSVYVADLDSYPQQDQALWHMATMLQGVLDNGAKPQQASRELSFAKSGRSLWGRAFGGGFLGKGEDAAPDYTAGSGGVMAGTNLQRFQYFGGLAQTNVRGDEEVSYKTKSISGFAGFAAALNQTVKFSATAGAAINSTDRDIADNTVAYGIDSDSTNYASVFFMPTVRLAGPIKGSSLRLMYAGLWQQGHSFNFSGGTDLDVDNRFAHFVQARFEMQHQVSRSVAFGYGLEASWSGARDMSFDLMGTSFDTPYDGGAAGRIFAKVDFGFGYAEIGRDTDERTSVQVGARVKF